MGGDPPEARDYEELCLGLAPRMKALAAKLTGSATTADDVFQEAVLRVWKQLPHLKDESNLRAYFARVVTNLCVDTFRLKLREKTDRRVPPDDIPSPSSGPAAEIAEQEAPVLRQAIGALPQKQRDALVLRYFEELSYPELARELGCSEVTARSHVSKAKAALKQKLRRLPGFESICRSEETK